MSSLVTRLSEGNHPVEMVLRPERSARYLKDCFERKFVIVRFTGTRGGTELAFRIDDQECDFANADTEAGEGVVRLAGNLVLDYSPVRCVAEIDLKTLSGIGHLELIDKSPT